MWNCQEKVEAGETGKSQMMNNNNSFCINWMFTIDQVLLLLLFHLIFLNSVSDLIPPILHTRLSNLLKVTELIRGRAKI